MNDMSTPIHRALHYVECYALHFPYSGAEDIALELSSLLGERLVENKRETETKDADEEEE